VSEKREKMEFWHRIYHALLVCVVILLASVSNNVMALMASSQVNTLTEKAKTGNIDALDTLIKEAREGNVNAQLNLGNLYAKGLGVPLDYKVAQWWYRQAAYAGNAQAQYSLGLLGVPNEYPTGTLSKRNHSNVPHAPSHSVTSNTHSVPVPTSRATSVASHAPPAATLSKLSESVLVRIPISTVNATQNTSSNEGKLTPQQIEALQLRVRSGNSASLARLTTQAQQGNIYAQMSLGSLYTGGIGVPLSYSRAVHWYEKAAQQGDAQAQYIVGVAYASGTWIPQNYPVAVRWLRDAAGQGNVLAANDLSNLYANGQGVQRSAVVAYALCDMLGLKGHATACTTRTKVRKLIKRYEVVAAQTLSREMSRPGNVINALDEYLAQAPDRPIIPSTTWAR
jgi:TPR repeat protein